MKSRMRRTLLGLSPKEVHAALDRRLRENAEELALLQSALDKELVEQEQLQQRLRWTEERLRRQEALIAQLESSRRQAELALPRLQDLVQHRLREMEADAERERKRLVEQLNKVNEQIASVRKQFGHWLEQAASLSQTVRGESLATVPERKEEAHPGPGGRVLAFRTTSKDERPATGSSGGTSGSDSGVSPPGAPTGPSPGPPTGPATEPPQPGHAAKVDPPAVAPARDSMPAVPMDVSAWVGPFQVTAAAQMDEAMGDEGQRMSAGAEPDQAAGQVEPEQSTGLPDTGVWFTVASPASAAGLWGFDGADTTLPPTPAEPGVGVTPPSGVAPVAGTPPMVAETPVPPAAVPGPAAGVAATADVGQVGAGLRARIHVNMMRFLEGKVVGADLRNANGAMVAVRGTSITQELVDRAQAEGVLADLILHMTWPEGGPA